MRFNDIMLKALSKEKTERPPVWFMRQAGRYMSQYMQIRNTVSFLELCKTPELAAEVTMQPVDILGVDAAILFSDIMIPLEPMGLDIAFTPSPIISNPVRTLKDADEINVLDPQNDVPFVFEIIKRLVKVLKVPLIGFSGGPFTLAAYCVEGRGSKNFIEIKKLMYNNTKAFEIFMEKITRSTSAYLQRQIDEGCAVVQVFDTWAGILSPEDYDAFALPWVKELFSSIKGAQTIYYVKEGGSYLDSLKSLKCDCIGLDWKTDILKADAALGRNFAIQGNLDSAVLFSNKETICSKAADIISKGRKTAGHVFNLGHGILPETPVNNVKLLVDFIKGEL